MKSGYKTSEFWLTGLTILGAVAAAVENILDPRLAAIAATISSVSYAISRGLAKR